MPDARIIPVVLSGGSGTRLWPVSREKHPKQLQPLLGDESLLQNILRRLEGLPLGAPIIVSNQEYRFVTAEQLRQLGLTAWTLLLEPAGRNTAPALTAAALYAMRDGADLVLLATPADHYVRNAEAFRAAVLRGLPEAETGYRSISRQESALAKRRPARRSNSWLPARSPMPRRKFLQVDDLADACVFLMEREANNAFYNIGVGADVTIRELAETIMAVVDFTGLIVFDSTKPDGTLRKLLDVSRLHDIGWQAHTKLLDGIALAHKDFPARHRG